MIEKFHISLTLQKTRNENGRPDSKMNFKNCFQIILVFVKIIVVFSIESEDEADVIKRIAFAPVDQYHNIPVDEYHVAPKDHIKNIVPILEAKKDEPDMKNDEEIKILLEEKYKFRNDETSTRYRIANDDRDYPGRVNNVVYEIH